MAPPEGVGGPQFNTDTPLSHRFVCRLVRLPRRVVWFVCRLVRLPRHVVWFFGSPVAWFVCRVCRATSPVAALRSLLFSLFVEIMMIPHKLLGVLGQESDVRDEMTDASSASDADDVVMMVRDASAYQGNSSLAPTSMVRPMRPGTAQPPTCVRTCARSYTHPSGSTGCGLR